MSPAPRTSLAAGPASGSAGDVAPGGDVSSAGRGERWVDVCGLDDLLPERGVAALVGAAQVAVFRLVDDRVLAVSQLDPFSGANVVSRGIVGSRGEAPTVASPMYKQVFDLRTGRCLDAAGKEPRVGGPDLAAWPVRVRDGRVLVRERPQGDA